ncbi:MAG: 30S ribosomal protein S6--L-glutamate ligase [Halobacteriovoraceae bacterium]|nr:30S ribosomal protein S6--L-glutamate ligase [Halobacteriovoraceae bacterium]MCB9095530.1 30S ribosomal protein S6--L-glutamate ligase [Halobacteriovoraceae bacterium]
MKLLLLTSNSKLYSSRRILDEARARGHTIKAINPARCYMDIAANDPMVFFAKKKLKDIDCIIPRIPQNLTFYGMALIRQFEAMNIFCANSADSIWRARDKLLSLQLLSKKGLPLPKTGFANSTKQTDDLIKLVGGAPLVVKLLQGTQGKGVVLAETKKASESLIDAFRELNAHFLVQEFIKESKGCDLRIFVVGNKVVASMMRIAKEGEFRSNIHRGAIGQKVRITPKEREVAIKATKTMGLNIAGVDIMRSSTGPKIIEINASPGLEGIEGATKINVAGKIIEYLETKIAN